MAEIASSPVYPDYGSGNILATGDVNLGLKNAVPPDTQNFQPGGGRRLADPVAREIMVYRLRALDRGVDPPVPVFWTSQDPSVGGAPPPPHGGPYTDVQIIVKWVQTAPAGI